MIKELQYTSIKRVLDNLTEHPLLRDLTLEQVVRYTIRFISIHGYPKLYQDKVADVDIHCYRGVLPCDLISIIQVKDLKTGVCLRAMTDNFPMGIITDKNTGPGGMHIGDERVMNKKTGEIHKGLYIPHLHRYLEEPAFKTQERIIYTTFPEGCIGISYKSLPVDEDGFPLLLDNENYLAALEAYIKKTVFTMKFDTGKVSGPVLQNAKSEYAWLSGQLAAEFTIPSVSEMEAITRGFNSLIPRMREFDHGFKHEGDREWIRKH